MTVPLDCTGRKRPVRDAEITSRKNAIAAARKIIASNGKLNRDEVAKEFDIAPSSVSCAVIILKHGTEAEIAAVETGETAIVTVYTAVCERVPVAERYKSRTITTHSAEHKERLRIETTTWKQLRDAIELICSMPRPADVAAMAKRNHVRTAVLDRKIIDAYSWLSEFSDEWTK